MVTLFWLVLSLAVALTLAYSQASGLIYGGATLLLAIGASTAGASWWLALILWLAFLVSIPLNITELRRKFVTDPLLEWFKKVLPSVSQTEQEALDAGTVWWDGELFGGAPDWDKLLAYPRPALSAEEQAFLDGPVEELCAMLDDWHITNELNDLPPEAWRFIKDKGFLGMIIPKTYGGLEFSALAHSAVVMKLASRSSAGCISVMVPNSLGPAELLLNYGTDEQKNYYLPRLAKGVEMPCFALTGPEAGSDAGAIPDTGIVCRDEFEGKQTIGIRLSWEKRYITLGPIATLLGLAFKLYDPDHLLGDTEDIGITLALIPTKTPGVMIGRRHAPLNAAFQNGPNSGRNVFIPLDWVIGGQARIGQGWRMLMECLAAGRSISLPSSSTGMAKLAARATGAYSRVRVQFNTPIGHFEGIEEALARIGGYAYLMEAARVMTAGAVDLGQKPAVVSAIAKYHVTELGRKVVTDAMDVHGGKAICLGPSNYLGRAWQQAPIGITVEGANILTRSMIIFGQGAIRCHPYVLREIAVAKEADPERASHDFDDALTGHVKFTLRNCARALVLALTGARFASVHSAPETRRTFQHLARFSAGFAFAADVAMLVLGGDLKRREKLSARLGDILSQLYLCSAALKRFEDEGKHAEDLPLLEWCVQDSLHKLQSAFDGLLKNFPNRWLAMLIRVVVFPLGQPFAPPSDRLGKQVARLLMQPSASRDRLTAGIFVLRDENDAVGRLDLALESALASEPAEAQIRAAVKSGTLSGNGAEALRKAALAQGVIGGAEAEQLARFERLRRRCIMVDDFPADFGERTQLGGHEAPAIEAARLRA
ncbi:MAG TPA: acyl-CoA dehydrogenase [Burkholderiales bacterium]|nr:acyl-CoA dehydrogenase [Burkholderiales bacterium]